MRCRLRPIGLAHFHFPRRLCWLIDLSRRAMQLVRRRRPRGIVAAVKVLN
jgi:hypothetical protein